MGSYTSPADGWGGGACNRRSISILFSSSGSSSSRSISLSSTSSTCFRFSAVISAIQPRGW